MAVVIKGVSPVDRAITRVAATLGTIYWAMEFRVLRSTTAPNPMGAACIRVRTQDLASVYALATLVMRLALMGKAVWPSIPAVRTTGDVRMCAP